MRKFVYNKFETFQLAKCCYCESDERVKGGLGYSPADAARMVDRGLPVTSDNCALMDSQGVPNPSWDVPLERQRGADLISLWSAERNAKKKIITKYREPVKPTEV